MIKLDKAIDFKYQYMPFRLPYNPSNPSIGEMVVMLISNSTQAADIFDNAMVRRGISYSRYLKPLRFREKVFAKTFVSKMDNTEIKNLGATLRTKNLALVTKAAMVQDRNVLVDSSAIHYEFTNNIFSKSYKMMCEEYARLLNSFIAQTMGTVVHTDKFLFVNANDWGISKNTKSDALRLGNQMINPISMIFYMLKKNPDALKAFKDYTMVILDGNSGWFKFTFKSINKKSYELYYREMKKFKSDVILNIEDTDDENTLDTKDDNATVTTATDKTDSTTLVVANTNDSKKESETEDEREKAEDANVNNEDEKIKIATQQVDANFNDVGRSVVENKRLEELRKRQKEIKLNNISMGKLDEPKNFTIEEFDISDKIFTPNKNVKNVRFDNFNKSYNENTMERDILNVFTSLNDKTLPVYVTKIDKQDTSTNMDLKYTYHVSLEDAKGVRHSLTIDVPRMYDNNFMHLGGNRKQFVNQQFLKPLVKIAPDTVQICTNYNKIFMYRYGEEVSPKLQVFKKIINDYPKYFKVKRGNAIPLSKGHKTSIGYDYLAKEYISIEIRGTGNMLSFDQTMYQDLINRKKIDSIGDDYIFVMLKQNGDKYIAFPVPVEDELDNLEADFTADEKIEKSKDRDAYRYDIVDMFANEFKQCTGKDFWSLGGPKEKPGKRFMYSRCTVMQKKIPTLIFLAYFEGLSMVMRKAGIKYSFSDTKPRDVDLKTGVVEFADGYLVFERTPSKHALLMNALSVVDTKGYNFSDFDSKGVYLDIFDVLFDSRILASGLDSYYDNMIDPITKEILDSLDLPTDFVSLVIAANDLLADNSYSSEIAMTEFRVRSNEMISAYLYKIIANAYSRYKRTSMNKNPTKISVPKDELIKNLLTSNVVEDSSIINPITEKEKLRSITSKGPSGINMDKAYTKEKRSFDDSMTGLMAISTSPDANCGVVREMTIEPKVINTRGFIDCAMSYDDMKDVNLFSFAEALTPGGVTRDDSIRTSMATKQSKHIVPVSDMSPVLISTGIEKTLPYTVSKDYAIQAKDNGIVKEIDSKTNMMILEYNDGSHEAVNLNQVVVKNGGGGFYLPNQLVTDLKVNDKFKKGDVIAQDRTFFSKHYDGPKFNIGTLCKAACTSSFATFEDSKCITQSLSERMATEMIMNKHIVLGKNANVSFIAKKGDAVKVGDELIRYEQSNSEEAVNKLLANIGDDLKEEIKNIGKTALKSKYTGTITDIHIYSTVPLDELSSSLQKIVGDYWKSIRSKKKIVEKYKITDPTYTGKTFAEMDGPVEAKNGKVMGYKLDDGVIIEFYIKFYDPVGVGDKLVDFAAIKGVTADVIPKGQECYTVNEPDEEISTIFPPNSVMARMVPSILSTMFCNKLLVYLKRQLTDIYKDDKK